MWDHVASPVGPWLRWSWRRKPDEQRGEVQTQGDLWTQTDAKLLLYDNQLLLEQGKRSVQDPAYSLREGAPASPMSRRMRPRERPMEGSAGATMDISLLTDASKSELALGLSFAHTEPTEPPSTEEKESSRA